MTDRRSTYILHASCIDAERHDHTTHHCSVVSAWRRCVASPGHPLVTQPGYRYRAPWQLAGATPPAWFPGAVRAYRTHPTALALGVFAVETDGAQRLYLSGDGALVYDVTPLLIVEATTTLPQRLGYAVDVLRQVGLPAAAEDLAESLRESDTTYQTARATPSIDRTLRIVEAHATLSRSAPTPGSMPWTQVGDLLRGVL